MSKTQHHRACHLCEAICGLTIETEDRDDGRHILSIKGDAQDSFSRGHLCPKAVALQDIQNDPDRVRQAAAAGHSVVFGDAARLALGNTAGQARATPSKRPHACFDNPT